MTGLEDDIISQDDAIEYARRDPDRALGVAIWNLIQLKENCACRLSDCRERERKGRMKNAAMQFGGGVVGGAGVVVTAFWVMWDRIAPVLEWVRKGQ